MSILDRFRKQEPEYSGYVQEVRDRKQAELNAAAAERSLYNKAKKYFRQAHPKNEVEAIASDDTPRMEFKGKKKRIQEYWDSIDDAPVIEPHHYAEIEIEKDVKQIAKVNQALKPKKSRKQELKEVERDAYQQARAEREAKKHAKAIEKAKAKGRYYGSTNVAERTVDRAKAVGRGVKKVGRAVSGIANEMGETRIGHSVKRVAKKSNGRLVYKHVGKIGANQKLPKSRPVGTRRESLPSKAKAGPSSGRPKASPSNGMRKGSPSSGKKGSPAGQKASHVTRKSKGFGMR